MVCPKCGKTNEDSRVYCYQCNELLMPTVEKKSVSNQSKRNKKIQKAELAEKRSGAIKANKKRKVRPTRVAFFAAVFAVVLVAGIIIIKQLMGVDISKLPVYYIKGDKLMAINYSDNREYIVSETPAIDSQNYDSTGMKDGAFRFTSNYKYCYLLQSGDDVNGYTLCKFKVGDTDLNQGDGTFVKIDEDVIDFKFNDNGKKVVYKKVGGTDGVGRLYYFDGKESHYIADNVYDYCVDTKFKVVYYTKHTDGQVVSLYEAKLKKPEKASKICDDVSEIESFGKSVVYVSQRGGEQYIHLKQYGKDEVELGKGKDIKIEKIYDDTIYYSEATEMTLNTKAVIEDSLAATDSEINEPKREDYETQEAYSDALKQYAEKLGRDSIRKYFEENPIKVPVYNLYVYKNGQTSVIDGTVTSIISYGDNGSVVYVKMSSNLEKLNILDYDYGDKLEEAIVEKFAKSGVLCVYRNKKAKTTVTNEKTPHTFEDAVVSGDYVYYVAKKSVLYCYNLSNGYTTELSSNVSKLITTNNKNVLYAVYDYQTNMNFTASSIYRVTKAEMQSVADDVANYSVIDDSNIVYVKCEQNKDYGTLYLNTNKKHTEIDTSVYAHNIIVRSKSSILYFKNYTEQSGYAPQADLYWYKNKGAALKSDTGVSSIVF